MLTAMDVWTVRTDIVDIHRHSERNLNIVRLGQQYGSNLDRHCRWRRLNTVKGGDDMAPVLPPVLYRRIDDLVLNSLLMFPENHKKI